MTAQIPDIVEYQHREYSLAGVSGSGLFEPSEAGLQPRPTSTANWRGFYCTYRVDASRLVLDTVHIGLEHPSPLFSREPTWHARDNCWAFENLERPMDFTGGLLLGDGFIQELYVHMGFHPGWKYETVLELEFQGGQLTAASDHSDSARRFRAGLRAGDLRPGSGASSERIQEWVERTFSLDYSRSDPFTRP